MSDASGVLDEAFERLETSGFELPNGFVNHGPMACEALATLDLDDDVGTWARRFARVGTAVQPVAPRRFEWQDALGDYGLLPEWLGYFEAAIGDDGWSRVVEQWVPRLLPGLVVALFHGEIRTAHAVRALSFEDSAPRRAELARALGYWAARYQEGQQINDMDVEIARADARHAVTATAADGARHYLAHPSIFDLHGVTGAMALEILAGHIPPTAAAAGFAQLRAEHKALYRDAEEARPDPAGIDGPSLAQAAATSGDPHQVKLVEACRRGWQATGDPAFAAAAERVTGLR